MNEPEEIATEQAQECSICGAKGAPLYAGLRDFVFGASGTWTLLQCSNPACRLIWPSPRPCPEEIHKAYRTYYTHANPPANESSRTKALFRRIYSRVKGAYLQLRFSYQQGPGSAWCYLLVPFAFLHPAGIDAVAVDAMFLPATKGGRLLEIGCGNGITLERMRERGWDVEGIDFDPACVNRIKARGLRCHLGDVRDLNLPSESFNAIYMGNVIEHVYDPKSFLCECLRLLRPAGTLILLTPNSDSWGHKHYGIDWRGLEPPRHIQVFNPSNLIRLTADAGFVASSVRTTNRGAWYILGTSRTIRSTRTAQNRDCLDREASLFSTSGLADELWGRIVRTFSPLSGEEILLTARKA